MKTWTKWLGALAGGWLAMTMAQAAPPPAELFFSSPDIVEAVDDAGGLYVTRARGLRLAGALRL